MRDGDLLLRDAHTLRKRFGVVSVGLSLFFGDVAAAISSP